MRGLYSALCFELLLAQKRKRMCSQTSSTVTSNKAITAFQFNEGSQNSIQRKKKKAAAPPPPPPVPPKGQAEF